MLARKRQKRRHCSARSKRGLQLPWTGCSLSGVTRRFARMKPLSTWLRWVLALVLVLNGALGPFSMAQATPKADSLAGKHEMSTGAHCHLHGASTTPDPAKPSHEECPCCDGSNCLCGCIAFATLPAIFPDLRPMAPQVFTANRAVPEPAVSPPSRLLRPPIA